MARCLSSILVKTFNVQWNLERRKGRREMSKRAFYTAFSKAVETATGMHTFFMRVQERRDPQGGH